MHCLRCPDDSLRLLTYMFFNAGRADADKQSSGALGVYSGLLRGQWSAPAKPLIIMYFSSVYSSRPYFDPSRPRPDCLTPPKGATSVDMIPSLIPTMPVSSASATRHARPRSRV